MERGFLLSGAKVSLKEGEIVAAAAAINAPGAKTEARAPVRTNMISGAAEAAIDVRKACNAMKRMASLVSASMTTGLDTRDAIAASREMALAVLSSIGFNVLDEARVEAVMPMMAEATSQVLADAARHAKDGQFGPKELAEAAALGVVALMAVAKSRAVAKLIEPSWPADIDAVTALRLTTASAMAKVAVEVAEFDFGHSASDCIKEASKVVVKAATDASLLLAPAQASSAARVMLTQSLINSAAQIYATAWRTVAADEVHALDALSEEGVEAELDKMQGTALVALMEPISKRFKESFQAVTTAATEMFPSAAPQLNAAATSNAGRRFRAGA